MRFSAVITRCRSDRGLGIRTLSKMIGVSPTHLRRLEANQSNPSEELVKKLSQVLNVDFDELMIAANRVPSDIVEYLLRNPSELRRIRAQITTQR